MSKATEFHVLQGRSAGFVTRLIAHFVDVAVISGILALSGWLAVGADSILTSLGMTPGVQVTVIYTLSIPIIIGTYFVILWSLTGRTIGKWIMGLKVVGRDGLPPTIGHALMRFIGYGVSTLVFWAGYLWVIVDDERQAWHDHIAKTWVIYDYERRKRGEVYETYRNRTEAKQTKD